MAKFMVLYRSSVEASEQMASASPEEAQAGMEMWMKWNEKAGPAVVDLGAPMRNAGTMPPDADTGVPVSGFSVLEADSADAIVGLLEDHPHRQAPGAVIEVFEYLPVPGM